MTNDLFDVPVLFIVFNRPLETEKVLQSIRNVKPKYLYVAADGPRQSNTADAKKCEAVRKLIENKIDWNCEVKTLFREKNLGCKSAVSGAINWFFNNEEMGIILEDDCFADQSFFFFCKEMLIRYKNDEDILAINGCNFNYSPNGTNSYFFSRYMNVWGWASWRRSATKIDYSMTSWNDQSKLHFLWSRLRRSFFDFDLDWYRYWMGNFEAVASGNLNTWDYQWQYHQWLHQKKTVVAARNLIINLGFGNEATHTSSESHPSSNLTLQTLDFPLQHSVQKSVDKVYEEVAIKPVWHLHTRKANKFYISNYINSSAVVQYFRSKLK